MNGERNELTWQLHAQIFHRRSSKKSVPVFCLETNPIKISDSLYLSIKSSALAGLVGFTSWCEHHANKAIEVEEPAKQTGEGKDIKYVRGKKHCNKKLRDLKQLGRDQQCMSHGAPEGSAGKRISTTDFPPEDYVRVATELGTALSEAAIREGIDPDTDWGMLLKAHRKPLIEKIESPHAALKVAEL
jgi:hypothetical protein